MVIRNAANLKSDLEVNDSADRQTDRQYGAGMLEAAVWILQELRCEVRLKACMASLGDASRSEM